MSEFNHKSLGQLADCRMGETILSKDLDGYGYPIFSADSSAGAWGLKKDISKVLKRGCIVLGARGTIGNPRLPDHDEFGCTQTTIAVTPSSEVDPYYLKLALEYSDLKKIAAQQAVPMLSIGEISKLELPIPLLPEQKKIADILSGVDSLIRSNQKRISKLEKIRESLTSEVDKFIIANKYGGLDIVKELIPSGWRLVRFSDVLRVKMEGFSLSENEFYSPVIVRRRHSGVETRGTKSSVDILVKKQFYVRSGCFLISKRQVIHGSTGIVPKQLGRNPIISKEYLQLESKNKDILEIDFLNFYSRTALFYETIRMSVYGVDIEKYVFKERTWFNKLMLLPPVEEQKMISNSCIEIENAIFYSNKKLEKLLNLKKAISSELLSGHKRVKV